MRYRAARTRTTLNRGAVQWSGSGAFYLRPDIELTLGHYLLTCDNLFRTFLSLCGLICLLRLMRPTENTFILLYLPVWIYLFLPLGGGFRISGFFTGVVFLGAVYLCWLFNLLNGLLSTYAVGFALALLLTVVAFLVLFMFPLGKPHSPLEQQRSFSQFGLVSLALAGAVVWLLEPWDHSLVTNALVVTTIGVTACSGVVLLRMYAGWLACSPELSFEAAQTLADISHCPLKEIASCLPASCRWMTVALMAGPFVIVAESTLFAETGGTHFFVGKVQGFLGEESVSTGVWVGGMAFALAAWKQAVCAVGAICGAPVRICLWPALGILRPLAVWEADSHPTPFAPGIYAANRFDVFGFPVRRLLTTAVVAPALYALMLQQVAGTGQGAEHFDTSWLVGFILEVVEGIVVAIVVTLLAVGLSFSPLLAYVEGVAGGTIAPFVRREPPRGSKTNR